VTVESLLEAMTTATGDSQRRLVPLSDVLSLPSGGGSANEWCGVSCSRLLGSVSLLELLFGQSGSVVGFWSVLVAVSRQVLSGAR
jgi:hypothetical protein